MESNEGGISQLQDEVIVDDKMEAELSVMEDGMEKKVETASMQCSHGNNDSMSTSSVDPAEYSSDDSFHELDNIDDALFRLEDRFQGDSSDNEDVSSSIWTGIKKDPPTPPPPRQNQGNTDSKSKEKAKSTSSSTSTTSTSESESSIISTTDDLKTVLKKRKLYRKRRRRHYKDNEVHEEFLDRVLPEYRPDCLDSGSDEGDDEGAYITAVDSNLSSDDSLVFDITEEPNNYTWSANFYTFSGHKENYDQQPGPNFVMTPTEMFFNIWDRPIMEHITKETNEYARQTMEKASQKWDVNAHINTSRLNEWYDTTVEELYQFLAILIYMGLMYRDSYDEYWAKGPFESTGFGKVMSQDRFLLYIRFLHFANNNEIRERVPDLEERKLAKVEPVLAHCNSKFKEMYTPYRTLAMDMSSCFWNGTLEMLNWRAYTVARYGMASYDLYDAKSGYILKCITCIDENANFDSEPLHGFTSPQAKAVIKIMDGYIGKGHCLILDKHYNSVPLARFLKRYKTDVIGNLNTNHQYDIPRVIYDLKFGEICDDARIVAHCGDVSLWAWKSKKWIVMTSTYHCFTDMELLRWEKNGLPSIEYKHRKQHSRNVCRFFKLRHLLKHRIQLMKWNVRLFWRLFDCSIHNCYIMYKMSTRPKKRMTHRQVRFALAAELLSYISPTRETRGRLVGLHFPAHKKKPSSTNSTDDSSDDDCVPIRFVFERGQCVLCAAKNKSAVTEVICRQCKVFLCVDQCWKDYHTLEDI